jgi:hypothetical protein
LIYCYYVNGSNSLIPAYNLGDEIDEKCLRFKASSGDGRTVTPKYHSSEASLSVSSFKLHHHHSNPIKKMASDSANIYTPLDPSKAQIRLVTLQPASSRKDVVRCTLSISSLDEPGRSPVYEALSYEWGLPKSESFIVLDGRRTQVRENLYQALLHLRHPEKASTLWVDALCINQSDVDERNRQVQLMGQIFMRAVKVLAWFGLDDEWTSAAFDLLRRAGAQHFAGDLRKLIDWKRPEYCSGNWAALENFCFMTYWNRL